MKLIKTKFKGLIIYKRNTYKDNRGYFRELFLDKQIKEEFPFDAMSYSKKNVLRGLHLQLKNTQSKYVNVLKGKIFDVCVDCRKNSKTFGKYFSTYLSEKENSSLLIPKGFAHGFCALTNEVIVHYKCSTYRDKNSEIGILWNDKDLKIKWPIKKQILSKKDKDALSFNDFKKKYLK
ncbi:dTDP-4-dehydrorhamnose 3,5-epimerase [Candidatus Pelagibacter sp.]|nr:dTDP-4-dehydrorhamnose 3,5-epimerase [Candidatus Pelagibacter sp.]